MTRLFALLAAAMVLLIGGCSSTPASQGGTRASNQLQFTAKTLAGQPFSGESLRGRPAVLWFWAPWCPTCQREAPMVARVAAAHPAVTFVGVGAQDQLPALQEFVGKYHLDGFTELADTDATVWAKFGVTRQPAYAFVSRDGGVDVVKGSLPEADLTARVQALAGQ
ncbi:protein disulfide oxidoreductase [Mycobacterium talmoniae]|uniref:Soluble secreted antigen MPT53 n=1 Tax=Mycobacterium talmoniae TaxID=1858794 RepID=A0A1S1NE02_9MYCO|nr:thiol:disulfide interchange protein [Mycobacterium talmoniae]PQM44465.1 Soluble secreted antigen MPT53 [Mycobacterium talmoniae]TDH50764.1 protein disulfide oxidoreductase [Mycobacterium eburneum]